MKISSKGRYGLASLIYVAQKIKGDECITISKISTELNISKIYLEQVFSLLKRANIVISIKGAQGGYQLADSPDKITVKQILSAIEVNMFEKTDATVNDSARDIEIAMNNLLWEKIDTTFENLLNDVTLYDLVEEAKRNNPNEEIMFYI